MMSKVRRSTAIARPSSNESLIVVVDRAARESGLGQSLTSSEPQGPGLLRVRLEKAPFDIMIGWLGRLADQNGISVETANIDGAGVKGVEKLVAAVREIEIKLAETNKALAAGNGKDVNAKNLVDALASRDALKSELKELKGEFTALAQTIEAAYKELAEAKLVAPGGDPRKDLLAGAKAARTRASFPNAFSSRATSQVAMPKQKTSDRTTEQSKRFIDTARELGADESGEAFEQAFGKIVPPKRPKPAQECRRSRGGPHSRRGSGRRSEQDRSPVARPVRTRVLSRSRPSRRVGRQDSGRRYGRQRCPAA